MLNIVFKAPLTTKICFSPLIVNIHQGDMIPPGAKNCFLAVSAWIILS